MFEQDPKDHLGRGATADVYKAFIDGRYYALKIYKKPDQINWSKLKALTELGNDQEFSFVKTHAWPLGIIQKDSQNIGFAMELFDLGSFKTVDHYYDNILRSQISDTKLLALPNLILIAKNLSIEIEKFHKKNIYLIDIKPQNIAINTLTNEVIILDCDGFSFERNGVHYPSDFVSPDYIAPEVTINRLSPQSLGRGQDLYALSVLNFQILNRGLHPYSGVTKVETNLNTNDDRATSGNYAYGDTANPAIAPHVSSLHLQWENNILSAFESCFTGSTRTSAAAWVQIFERIEHSKGYVRCDKFQQNSLHIKFRDKECMQCKLDGLQAPPPVPTPVEPSIAPQPRPVPQPTQNTPQKMTGFAKFLLVSVLVLIVWAFLKNASTKETQVTDSSSTIVAETTKVTCGTNPQLCDEEILCSLATSNGRWDTSYSNRKYSDAAKQRGLDCKVTVEQTARANDSCFKSAYECTDKDLCKYAAIKTSTGGAFWTSLGNLQGHVNLAKRRGLSCGVYKTAKKIPFRCKNTASSCNAIDLCSEATTQNLNGELIWDQYNRAHVAQAKRRNLACGVITELTLRPKPRVNNQLCSMDSTKNCPTRLLCARATTTVNGVSRWRSETSARPYITEAKRRNLKCMVSSANQTKKTKKLQRYESGDRYFGEIVDGIRNGRGIYTWVNDPNVVFFEGEWRNGKRAGQGKIVFKDGTIYIGNWINDKRSGPGFQILSKQEMIFSHRFDQLLAQQGAKYNSTVWTVYPHLKNKFIELAKFQRKRIQANLKREGLYDGTIDGVWGKKTLLGIVEFSSINLSTVDLRSTNTVQTILKRLLR